MKIRLILLLFISMTQSLVANTPEEYIHKYKSIAIEQMKSARIPASIILAQGMLESDFGKGELAIHANNHFGIKCGSDWQGASYNKMDDDKDAMGNLIESCFRSYPSVRESYKAHSDFLTNPNKAYRYGFLFKYDSDDYVSWAKGLLKAGYATDKNYAKKLIAMIENYELFVYDKKIIRKIVRAKARGQATKVKKNQSTRPNIIKREKAKKHTSTTVIAKTKENTINSSNKQKAQKEKAPKRKKETNTYHNDGNSNYILESSVVLDREAKISRKNGLDCIKIHDGDTPRAVAKLYNMHVDRLLSYNKGIEPDALMKKGDVLYLEYKHNNYKGPKKYHIVKKGETMYSISQLYGIKLDRLYHKNRLPEGAEPIVGERVSFRTVNLFGVPKYKMPKEKETFLFD